MTDREALREIAALEHQPGVHAKRILRAIAIARAALSAEPVVEPTEAPTCDWPDMAHRVRGGRSVHWHGKAGHWVPCLATPSTPPEPTEEAPTTARLFTLVRDEDVSGVSGTGVVAEGIEFSDGVVALRWIVPPGRPGTGFPTSVVFHDNGIESVRAVHGHSGKTRIAFATPSTPAPTDAQVEAAARAISRVAFKDQVDWDECVDEARAALLAASEVKP